MSELTDRVFKTVMGESAYAEHKAREEYHKQDVAGFEAMTDEQLAEKAARYWHHCERVRWPRGTPVYDAVMAHVIIPEMIRRLRD